MTESLAVPPAPLQVSASVAGSLRVTDCEPLLGFVPPHAARPVASQAVASVLDQLRVIEPPRRIDAGLALSVTVGGLSAGGSLTVMLTVSEAVPPAPEQLML